MIEQDHGINSEHQVEEEDGMDVDNAGVVAAGIEKLISKSMSSSFS